METTTITSKVKNDLSKRQHYIDWIRVLAFGILIFYHSGMFFVSWGWHVKNNIINYALEPPMEWLHQWRLPLLFFISGVGVSFAMKSRTGWQFVGERTKRLFLPLVFGMFVIVPPQIYFERIQRHQITGSYLDFYPNVFHFVSYPKGDFSWHHLWFIAYLWIYSVICTPLFLWLKSDSFKSIFGKLNNKWILLSFSFLPMIAYWTLSQKWEVTNNLTSDWYNFTVSFLIFVFGYLVGLSKVSWDTMEQNRKFFAGIAIFITVFRLSYDAIFGSIPEDALWILLVNGVLVMLNIWSSILAICGFAKHYLNFKNAFLTYSNEAVYPFYILHQTITVALGFYMAESDLYIWLKLVLLSLGTFLIAWIIYHFLIRPFNVIRPLFGLKSKN